MKLTDYKLKDFLDPNLVQQYKKTETSIKEAVSNIKTLPSSGKVSPIDLLRAGERAGSVTTSGVKAKEILEKGKIWAKENVNLIIGIEIIAVLGIVLFISTRRN